jgi:3-hydroxyisobutyrate dehydrogenase
VAQSCTTILVVVVDARQIEEVLHGAQGMLAALGPDRLVLLQSTIAPADAARLAASIVARGALALDAPISGGPARARAGALSIMVAGTDHAFDRAQPVLDALAARTFRVGAEAGLGATMKLVNNLLAGIHLAAGAEAFALGVRAGLDPRTMHDVFAASSGQSWMLSDRLARVLEGDLQPRAQMHILAKDLRLGLDLERGLGMKAALGAAASAMFESALAAGLADADDSMLIRWQADGGAART